jgi:hypothetical protein
MSYRRITLSALAGTVIYFVYGGIVFGALPWLRSEFARFPAVYRTQESMLPLFPLGIASMFVAVFVMATVYAMAYQNGFGLAAGTRFGALFGAFAVCGFVVHNYVNLNIGLTLTIEQALAYFVEWTLVGAAIGLIYRRPA